MMAGVTLFFYPVGPDACPSGGIISCKYFLLLTLWRCSYTLAFPYFSGQACHLPYSGNLHPESQEGGHNLEKVVRDSGTKSDKRFQWSPVLRTSRLQGRPWDSPGQCLCWSFKGLQVCRWPRLLRRCFADSQLRGARQRLLSHFLTDTHRPAFSPPNTPVPSCETVCRHHHLNPAVAWHADSHLLCCINTFEVQERLSHEERRSFAPFLYFRDVGFQWEFADSYFTGWVNEGRWLAFPLSKWEDARGLAGTRMYN